MFSNYLNKILIVLLIKLLEGLLNELKFKIKYLQ